MKTNPQKFKLVKVSIYILYNDCSENEDFFMNEICLKITTNTTKNKYNS